MIPDRHQAERRGPGRPKGGRGDANPILELATHPAPLVTVAQLAAYWGQHPYTLTAYIRKGRLDAIRVGGEYRIPVSAALTFEHRAADWRPRHRNAQ